jgi:ABC-type phosphate transport system substrate-binding protein
MMQSICPQSRCRPTAAFRRVALAVCLVSALLSPARALAAETPKVQVVGPRAVEDLARALARAFGPAGGSLAFKRIDNPRAAAGNFLAGRDMLLTLGRLDKKDLTYVRERWDALAPQEHVVGARAVAIAVHERCPVESLTLDQLESIYSGKAGDWSVFGGAGKPIRRYGLAFSDPLTTMFHTRLLPATKCPLLSRKKDSKQAIASLASDPAGIAFVDAIAAGASGTTVRTVAIAPAASAFGGPDEQAVLPNAQTIADGTYPFAEVLVLYVSPEASDAGEAFAKFILAGKGDAVFRKHGFMPTLRAVRGDILAAFEKLYGPDIKRVKAASAEGKARPQQKRTLSC